jgi:hypothetical protein
LNDNDLLTLAFLGQIGVVANTSDVEVASSGGPEQACWVSVFSHPCGLRLKTVRSHFAMSTARHCPNKWKQPDMYQEAFLELQCFSLSSVDLQFVA